MIRYLSGSTKKKDVFMRYSIFSIVIALIFVSFVSQSQSISNSYVNPGYGIISGDVSLTYSVGDIFYGELGNDQLIISAMFPAPGLEPTGIHPPPGENEILIYPNPCHATIYLHTIIKEDLVINLYSLNGVLLEHVPFSVDQGVDVSYLPNGLYIIKITDTDQSFYFIDKLIKSN